MTGEFCGASLFHGFPAFQRPTEAREKERHLRNIEIPGYRRGHNIPEASLEPPYENSEFRDLHIFVRRKLPEVTNSDLPPLLARAMASTVVGGDRGTMDGDGL